MAETNFNFDHLPARRGTGSIKWDRYPDYDPYWVADMDFPSPDCVVQALRERVDHGVFGYANAHEGLNTAVLSYLERVHDTRITDKEIVHLPGLVPALSLACRAFSGPGDQVMISTPVYYPFLKVPNDAGSNILDVPHIRHDDAWQFDWDAMETAVTPSTKLLILCNPQNPLGRVFSETEITKLAEFCQRHDLILVSDEIHCDLILDPAQSHFSALRLPSSLKSRLIVLMAPSKTYNIAGLGYSFAVIENSKIRSKFKSTIGFTLPEINALAMVAAEAAYNHGETWRRDLVDYLRANRDTLTAFIREQIPRLVIHEHSATYLYWIDCSSLGLNNPCEFFAREAGIFLTDGGPFGSKQHVRFNFGCPRQHMLDGLNKMKKAVQKL